MSNRSYVYTRNDNPKLNYIHFQFPVGMSNRSYCLITQRGDPAFYIAFNSPWECRIGLTLIEAAYCSGLFEKIFQFPVGMSNRSYQRAKRRKLCRISTFNSLWECRIGLTNDDVGRRARLALTSFNSPWECRIGLT